MHGTFRDIQLPPVVHDNGGEGWTPCIPWFFQMKEVERQTGHRPTIYVMRKRDSRKWLYRACTAAELSEIEKDAGH